jgi:Subtilisin inhibitor-like
VLRSALLLAVVALASGCGGGEDSADEEPSQPATKLEISVWNSGMDGPVRNWTLECPPGGSLPNAATACARLEALGDEAFAPLAKDIVCAQIYGGPQVAEVRGTFDGRPVEARFNRTNGCEMERWNRHEFLFPTA